MYGPVHPVGAVGTHAYSAWQLGSEQSTDVHIVAPLLLAAVLLLLAAVLLDEVVIMPPVPPVPPVIMPPVPPVPPVPLLLAAVLLLVVDEADVELLDDELVDPPVPPVACRSYV
jgi:hypothetical protein